MLLLYGLLVLIFVVKSLNIIELDKLKHCDQGYINRIKLEKKECQVLYRGLSSLVGAAAGDAIGGRVEFWKPGGHNGNYNTDTNWQEAIDRALDWKHGVKSWESVGGGVYNLTTGEITDDTAMAISLSRGLIKNSDPTNLADLQNEIFQQYHGWANPEPFDIGGTTSKTIRKPNTVQDALKAAKKSNDELVKSFGNGALSNGALMRIMPLALYSYKLTNNEIYQLVKLDSDLTNSNQLVTDSVTAYVIVLKNLINPKKTNTGVARAAVNAAKSWLNEHKKLEEETQVAYRDSNRTPVTDYPANIVLKWLEPIKQNITIAKSKKYPQGVKFNEDKKIGQYVQANGGTAFFRVDVAIQRAFYWLLQAEKQGNKLDYKKIIEEVIRECGNDQSATGDTDTNAGIVGGLIGAFYELDNIPEEYRKTLSKVDTREHLRENHPKFPTHPVEDYQAKWYWTENYHLKNGPLALELIKKAPNTIKKKVKKGKQKPQQVPKEEPKKEPKKEAKEEKDKKEAKEEKDKKEKGERNNGEKQNKKDEKSTESKQDKKGKNGDKQDKKDEESAENESNAESTSSFKYYIINIFLFLTFFFALFMFRS